jgi:hypothetical protein
VNAPTISPVRPIEAQQILFRDVHRIESPAATRNLVGAFYEEATRVMLGADRHTTDGRCEICPDLSLPGRNTYVECKAIGRGRQGLIYAQRLANDGRMVKATAFRTVEELHAALAVGVRCVLVVPFERIRSACRKLTPRVMNYRAGNRKGSGGAPKPMPGYRLPWSLLERLSTGVATVRRAVGQVHNLHMPAVELHGPELSAILPELSDHERETAGAMLFDLSSSAHRVVAQEAPEPKFRGHKVLVVESTNPEWYRKLCADHLRHDRENKSRHPDTDIRRPQVLESLDRLSRGVCRFPYDWMLRPIVEAQAARQHAHLEPAPF